MKKLSIGLSVVAVGLAISAATFAGTKGTHEVLITVNTDGSFTASGSFGDARASTSRLDEIGCSTSATQTSVQLTCFARNSSVLVTCTTSNPNFIQSAAALTSNASINFGAASSVGECTSFSTFAASWATPVQP